MRPYNAAVNGFGMILDCLTGPRELSEGAMRRSLASRSSACMTEDCCRSRHGQKVSDCQFQTSRRSLFIILFLTSVVRTISGETSK